MPCSSYDNTSLSCFKSCAKNFALRHVCNWRREGKMPASLLFGLSWHNAMDALWIGMTGKIGTEEAIKQATIAFNSAWVLNEGTPENEMSAIEHKKIGKRLPSRAESMLKDYAYLRYNFLSSILLLGVEVPFCVKIADQNYTGKLDKVYKDSSDKCLVLDHKTSSLYSIQHGFNPDYIDSWHMKDQIAGYIYSTQAIYPEEGVSGAMMDFTLVHDKLNRFLFCHIKQNAYQREDWLETTTWWIEQAEEAKEKQYYPKNRNSCTGLYRTCPFFDLCLEYKEPEKLEQTPDGFIVDPWTPFDQSILEE
jgi:hypothetical protein